MSPTATAAIIAIKNSQQEHQERDQKQVDVYWADKLPVAEVAEQGTKGISSGHVSATQTSTTVQQQKGTQENKVMLQSGQVLTLLAITLAVCVILGLIARLFIDTPKAAANAVKKFNATAIDESHPE